VADDPVLGFYEGLAADYHLIYDDWWAAVEETARVLGTLLRREGVDPPASVLDPTCGIGTQVLGVAQLGYRVHGSDLSSAAVARARREADRRGIEATFSVADVRSLAGVEGGFDAVVSFDNSLPHLLTDDDLSAALHALSLHLAPSGVLLASVRDYDTVVDPALQHDQRASDRPAGTVPRIIHGPHGRRVVTQAWSWDGDCYDVDLFLLHELADGWHTSHHTTRYRAWTRSELSAGLETAGFADVRWVSPDDSGYYQPIVVARA
jgi:SAM-dependent methyltransferase